MRPDLCSSPSSSTGASTLTANECLRSHKSIYPEGGPIDLEERVFTRRGDQSTERKEYHRATRELSSIPHSTQSRAWGRFPRASDGRVSGGFAATYIVFHIRF
eukprot:3774434-Pyramimonas_sp.AAC.1